jgi:hypothetical protein
MFSSSHISGGVVFQKLLYDSPCAENTRTVTITTGLLIRFYPTGSIREMGS